MGKKDRPKKNRYRAVIAIVIAGIVFLTFPRAEERNFRELLMEDAELELLDALCPVIAAAGDQWQALCVRMDFSVSRLSEQNKNRAAGAGKF